MGPFPPFSCWLVSAELFCSAGVRTWPIADRSVCGAMSATGESKQTTVEQVTLLMTLLATAGMSHL